MREGQRTSLRTSSVIKPVFFQGHQLFFRATNSLTRKMRYVLGHFRRSYLKANKVSKREETRKVEYAYNF